MPIKTPDGQVIAWFRNPLKYGFIGWLQEPGVAAAPNGKDTALSFGPTRVSRCSIKAGGTWHDTAGAYNLLIGGKDIKVPVWWNPDDPAHMEEMNAMIRDHNISSENCFSVESYRMVQNAAADPKKPWESFVREPVRRAGVMGCLRFLVEVSQAAQDVLDGKVDVGELADASTKVTSAVKRAASAEAEAAVLKQQLDESKRLLEAFKMKDAEEAGKKHASNEHLARAEKSAPKPTGK